MKDLVLNVMEGELAEIVAAVEAGDKDTPGGVTRSGSLKICQIGIGEVKILIEIDGILTTTKEKAKRLSHQLMLRERKC